MKARCVGLAELALSAAALQAGAQWGTAGTGGERSDSKPTAISRCSGRKVVDWKQGDASVEYSVAFDLQPDGTLGLEIDVTNGGAAPIYVYAEGYDELVKRDGNELVVSVAAPSEGYGREIPALTRVGEGEDLHRSFSISVGEKVRNAKFISVFFR